ncbi:MAG: hypothetical protein ABIJ81_04120 [Patescibacteria group bacterium]
MQGDEITISAMYNTFANSSVFNSDFAYHHLPPFYPPLFFWIFSLIGKIMNWNGILMAKFAAFCFFLLFPVGLYYFIKYLTKDQLAENNIPGKIFILLSPLLIITILDKDLLIGKPYEVITAALTIFWYISLHLQITSGKWSKKMPLIYGIIAGLIFMTYYLWLIFAVISFIIIGLVEKRGLVKKYFLYLFQTMIVAFIVSTPFLLPLFISYLKTGMESWQTSFFTPSGLDLWLPMFKLSSINNVLLLFGFAILIYYRNNKYIRQLIYLFLTAFIWWGLGIASLLIFNIPVQEFRGFYILAPSILVISAAYGIERIWCYFNINQNKNLYYVITIIGVVYFSTQSIFGFFIDDPLVKNRRVESKNTQIEIINLVKFLQATPSANTKLTLQTTPQIMAFIPINNLIYFNQHNNHPSAIFSKRYEYIQSLANSRSSEEFYEEIKNCPYGKVEQLIFYSDSENYYLYFHLDKIIQGIEEKTVKINRKLLASEYFEKIYDNNNYVVINIRYDN